MLIISNKIEVYIMKISKHQEKILYFVKNDFYFIIILVLTQVIRKQFQNKECVNNCSRFVQSLIILTQL